MKVAIISDLHDNIPYLDIFLSFCKQHKINKLLITGDVGSLETLLQIPEALFKKIYFVFGNADNFSPADIPPYIISLGESGIIKFENKHIGLCHEPEKIAGLLKDKPDIIFYGHTHKPWVNVEGKTLIINPGTLGGVFTASTFAVWDLARPAPELIRTDELDNPKY
mgnify:CR=1 FL=1